MAVVDMVRLVHFVGVLALGSAADSGSGSPSTRFDSDLEALCGRRFCTSILSPFPHLLLVSIVHMYP